MRKIIHVDEPTRLRLYRQLALEPPATFEGIEERDQRRLLMLGLRLFDGSGSSLFALLEPLLRSARCARSSRSYARSSDDRIAVTSQVADVPPDWPLAAHRTYARDEILAAVGESTVEKRVFSREGLRLG